MKDIQDFIDKMVNIEVVWDEGRYWHYPFKIFVEKEDWTIEFWIMMIEWWVSPHYKIFIEKIKENSKRVYMSIDFPAGMDMENEFVGVFQYENETVKIKLLPYTVKDNKPIILPAVEDGVLYKYIREDFNRVFINH